MLNKKGKVLKLMGLKLFNQDYSASCSAIFFLKITIPHKKNIKQECILSFFQLDVQILGFMEKILGLYESAK